MYVDFLKQSLYYPASWTDGAPIRFCNHRFSNFVYADYSLDKQVLQNALKNPGLYGYELAKTTDIKPEDLFGLDWQAFQVKYEKYIKKLHFEWENPYCTLFKFNRSTEFDNEHGPEKINILFIKGEGIAVYDALYTQKSITPECVAHIRSGIGFGGNYSDYAKLLSDTLKSNTTSPRYILFDELCKPGAGDYIKIVEDYQILIQWSYYTEGYGNSKLRFAEYKK